MPPQWPRAAGPKRSDELDRLQGGRRADWHGGNSRRHFGVGGRRAWRCSRSARRKKMARLPGTFTFYTSSHSRRCRCRHLTHRRRSDWRWRFGGGNSIGRSRLRAGSTPPQVCCGRRGKAQGGRAPWWRPWPAVAAVRWWQRPRGWGRTLWRPRRDWRGANDSAWVGPGAVRLCSRCYRRGTRGHPCR